MVQYKKTPQKRINSMENGTVRRKSDLLLLFLALVCPFYLHGGDDLHTNPMKSTVPELYHQIGLSPKKGLEKSATEIANIQKTNTEIQKDEDQNCCTPAILTDEQTKHDYDAFLKDRYQEDGAYPTEIDIKTFEGYRTLHNPDKLNEKADAYHALKSTRTASKIRASIFFVIFLITQQISNKIVNTYHDRNLKVIETEIEAIEEVKRKDPATRAVIQQKIKICKNREANMKSLCSLVPYAFLMAVGASLLFPR